MLWSMAVVVVVMSFEDPIALITMPLMLFLVGVLMWPWAFYLGWLGFRIFHSVLRILKVPQQLALILSSTAAAALWYLSALPMFFLVFQSIEAFASMPYGALLEGVAGIILFVMGIMWATVFYGWIAIIVSPLVASWKIWRERSGQKDQVLRAGSV